MRALPARSGAILALVILFQSTSAAPRPSAPGASDTWWSEIERGIAEAEYQITWQVHATSWQAPNRAQGFRTYFTDAGIRVVPREQAGAWEWSLALSRWGRPSSTQPMDVPRIRVNETRIEFDRGGIVEWYVNDRRGLEQGFTLEAPPAVAGDDTSPRVHLDLALGGTLNPAIAVGGQAIDFVTPEGAKVLHYAALTVRDASGRELKAWMEGFSGPGTLRGIRIVFEDDGATYPVTIDPLATSPAWMADGGEPGASFGRDLGTAGDVNGDGYADVIVGAPFYDNSLVNQGRVFVYHGSASGPAASPAWTADGDEAEQYFGYNVATAGDINGDGYSDVIVATFGAVTLRLSVYHGSSAGLGATPVWMAELDFVPRDLATAGDVNGDGYSDVIVGGKKTGAELVVVYHGSPSGLATTPAWTAEGDQASAYFGESVGTAGDVNGDGYADVLIGAPHYGTNQGRAFVYHGSASGLGASPAWMAQGDEAIRTFGHSVATAGDVNGDGYADVIVGASGFLGDPSARGHALAYLGSAAGLAPGPAWTVEGDQAEAFLGWSVATAGDVNGDGYADVIVGVPGYDSPVDDEGRAYVYLGSAAGLSTNRIWNTTSGQEDSGFGEIVATAGDVDGDGYSEVIVGASTYNNSYTDEGRAFVYHGSAAGLQRTAAWTVESDQVDAGFGYATTAGDVNGDGYADVVVAAGSYDNGLDGAGRAFVYHGSAVGLATSPAWTAEGDQVLAGFGSSVATAGDVNGDGYADVIVGVPGYDNDQFGEGRAVVYHGSAGGLATDPAWMVEGDQVVAAFGKRVATAGDVNGDGYADVILGVPWYQNASSEGRALVYHGSAAGLATLPAWTVESDQIASNFALSVATAGDVNGDGYSDVIVGEPQYTSYTDSVLQEGRALVFHGSPLGLETHAAWTAEGDQAQAFFGNAVATAGDVNGDGYADVVVGAHAYDNGEFDEGRALAYHGSPLGLETHPGWTAEGDQETVYYGGSVASAGDIDGDGYGDVVVGEADFHNGQFYEGRALAYHGSPAGLASSPAWTAEGNAVEAYFGVSVASAGDVNGDGYADVIVGMAPYDQRQTPARVFVYYGNGGAGLSLKPRQRRTADDAPIAHLGASDSLDGFRLDLLGRTPFGRGKVKLEWEVKPLGTLFDGTGTGSASDWTDSDTAGVELSEVASGLDGSTPHHWRVRLLYDPVTTPFQQHSRWLTVPWGGWQEWMLRTMTAAAAGRADSLLIEKAAGADLTLSWGVSCVPSDTDYAIYEGVVGDFTSHTSLFCTTGGATTKTLTPATGSAYYLIVPQNGSREGSYGKDSGGDERPAGTNACLVQQVGACE